MKRLALMGLGLAAILAAGVGGYWAGVRGLPLTGLTKWFYVEATLAASKPLGTGAAIYYQDPDGKPAYSAIPRQASTRGR